MGALARDSRCLSTLIHCIGENAMSYIVPCRWLLRKYYQRPWFSFVESNWRPLVLNFIEDLFLLEFIHPWWMSLHRHHESQVWEYGGVAYVLATLNITCSVTNSNFTFFFGTIEKINCNSNSKYNQPGRASVATPTFSNPGPPTNLILVTKDEVLNQHWFSWVFNRS